MITSNVSRTWETWNASGIWSKRITLTEHISTIYCFVFLPVYIKCPIRNIFSYQCNVIPCIVFQRNWWQKWNVINPTIACWCWSVTIINLPPEPTTTCVSERWSCFGSITTMIQYPTWTITWSFVVVNDSMILFYIIKFNECFNCKIVCTDDHVTDICF